MVEYLENSGLPFTPQTRLTQDFLPKNNYVVHAHVLKFYLEQGLVLKRIHRGVQFYQSPWMKEYIEFNTEQRINARNEFEKDFFKLMVRIILQFCKMCFINRVKVLICNILYLFKTAYIVHLRSMLTSARLARMLDYTKTFE